MSGVVMRNTRVPIGRTSKAPASASERCSTLPAWLVLIGILLPAAQVQLYLANAKFTVGRVGILLLLIPAILRLFRKDRHSLLSDYFACAVAACIIGASAYTSGSDALSSAGAESLEFLGGYIVARGFFFGPAAIYTFIRVLKIVTACTVLLALVDNVSGRLIIQETFSRAFGSYAPLLPDYRLYWVRAASTFDHPILLGTFCTVACCIFLFSERRTSSKVLWTGLSFFGCLLALSSAPLLSCCIALALFAYDRLLKAVPLRWRALQLVLSTTVLAIFAVTNHPLGWIVSHLTLDPESGYFRMLIWDAAIPMILDSPLAGYAFGPLNDDILDTTVDAVWLVFALRFGIPMIFFLALTNIASFLPTKNLPRGTREDGRLPDLRVGFTIVILMFMFTGLTVHYWNYMWIFWGVCIGLRASLREFSMYQRPAQSPVMLALAPVT
jgi:O-Antigen ligase